MEKEGTESVDTLLQVDSGEGRHRECGHVATSGQWRRKAQRVWTRCYKWTVEKEGHREPVPASADVREGEVSGETAEVSEGRQRR